MTVNVDSFKNSFYTFPYTRNRNHSKEAGVGTVDKSPFHERVCEPGAEFLTMKSKSWTMVLLSERVTGRKARGLQTEEIGCKCQTFLSLLSGKRKQTRDIFSFSI